MNLKIGLIGAPGAGKDTFADFLVNHKDFKKLAFAGQIKKEYYQASDITEEYFKSVRGQPIEQKIRDGLWAYSDEMRSKHGKLHFISPVVQEILEHSGNIVVTDIRTEDEFRQMEKAGAVMIIIIRDLKLDALTSKLPGTRLSFVDIMGVPVLWNHSNNVDTAHKEFDMFYNNIILNFF